MVVYPSSQQIALSSSVVLLVLTELNHMQSHGQAPDYFPQKGRLSSVHADPHSLALQLSEQSELLWAASVGKVNPEAVLFELGIQSLLYERVWLMWMYKVYYLEVTFNFIC